MPDDIKADNLGKYDMSHLLGLKDWIYETRIRARKDKNKSERKQQKGEKVAKRQAEQPTLFEF